MLSGRPRQKAVKIVQPTPSPPPPSPDYFPETVVLRRFVMFMPQLVKEVVAVELHEPMVFADVHVPMVLLQPKHVKQTLRRAKIDNYKHIANVLNIMNNMDLAIQAAEQEKDGINKLFDRLWEEQKQGSGK